jgi:hypothetical protein
LAAALADCKATVVLSGYDSPLYLELFDGWHRYEQQSMTGNARRRRPAPRCCGRTAARRPGSACSHPEHPARQCPVTLYGERCACDEPLAGEAQQPETQARRMMRSRFPSRPGTATVASDMCPRCKGDNSEAWALCARCAEQQPATQAPGTSPCTCADAGDCFAPAGHYADCPHHAPPAAVSQPDGEA